MEKKGQFYLIAAILIVLIIFSLTRVSNYLVIREKPKVVGETKTELSRESYRIVEYGIINQEDLYGDNGLLTKFVGEDFKNYYLGKSGEEDTGIILVFGNNKNNLKYAKIGKVNTGKINIGSFQLDFTNVEVEEGQLDIHSCSGLTNCKVTVEISGVSYNFNLKEGEIFYFVIVAEKGEERISETDEESELEHG